MIETRRSRLAWLLAILLLGMGSTCVVIEEDPYDYEGETEGQILEEGNMEEVDRSEGF